MTTPKGEQLWTLYFDKNGEPSFAITTKGSREYYYLYEIVEEKFQKLGKARSPVELEKKFDIIKKLG